jgi:hypothetical protein
MERSFISELKELLFDVQRTGGSAIENTKLPKEIAREISKEINNRVIILGGYLVLGLSLFSSTQDDFLGRFRALWIFLLKRGYITKENESSDVLIVAINPFIKYFLDVLDYVVMSGGVWDFIWQRIDTNYPDNYQQIGQLINDLKPPPLFGRDFTPLEILELLFVWFQGGDEETRLYNFAVAHHLIEWDVSQEKWRVTGVGTFFMELPWAQSIIFLLTLGMMFSDNPFRIRSVTLRNLVDKKKFKSDRITVREKLECLWLVRMGVLFESGSDTVEVSKIGEIMIHTVTSEDNPYPEILKLLIMTEGMGYLPRESAFEVKQISELIQKSEVVDDANRESIEKGLKLYLSGDYVEALKVIYPSLEAIINNMLIWAGEQPDHFKGLMEKVRWLEKNGYIPADLSHAIEIVTSRNRILHGNFYPDEEYAFPLCLLAFRYLKRLLTGCRLSQTTKSA